MTVRMDWYSLASIVVSRKAATIPGDRIIAMANSWRVSIELRSLVMHTFYCNGFPHAIYFANRFVMNQIFTISIINYWLRYIYNNAFNENGFFLLSNHSTKYILTKIPQMVPYPPNTVTGCMAFSATRHPARDTGPAGTAPLRNNCALVVFSTMKMLTAAIGQRTLTDAKNIVSH